jgi:hypothetical protein
MEARMVLWMRQRNFSKGIGLLFAMALITLLAPLPATGQSQAEYCAFEVAVKSPDGKPVVGTGAVLTRDGRIVGTAITSDAGIARICDAPFGALLDIEVGKFCGAVAVRHLSAYWMKTRRVNVTYSNCQGEEFVALGGCEFAIRAHDERDEPLSGVVFDELQSQAAQGEQPARVSDRFGRIFRFLWYGSSFTARLEKPGYAPKVVVGDCQVGGDPVREVTLVLSKR